MEESDETVHSQILNARTAAQNAFQAQSFFAALDPNFSEKMSIQRLFQNLRLALCTTSFITCSVAMTVFNKVALVAVPLPLVLVTLQMGVTVVLVLLWNAFAVCVGGRAWWQIKAGSKRDVLRWAPVSLLFAASLYTFTAALHYSTLGAVITWRNLAPLPTMLVECCCFSHARLGLGLALGQGLGLGSGSGLGLGLG